MESEAKKKKKDTFGRESKSEQTSMASSSIPYHHMILHIDRADTHTHTLDSTTEGSSKSGWKRVTFLLLLLSSDRNDKVECESEKDHQEEESLSLNLRKEVRGQ